MKKKRAVRKPPKHFQPVFGNVSNTASTGTTAVYTFSPPTFLERVKAFLGL